MPISIDGNLELERLDGGELPLIDGFSIATRDAGRFGTHVELRDGSGKRIAGFPWFDHVDSELTNLRDRTCAGTAAKPFHEVEQGWEILIWTVGMFVFVLEGDFEIPGRFDTAFRVPASAFMNAWDEVIASTPRSSFTNLAAALQNIETARSLRLGNRKLDTCPGEIGLLRHLEHLDLYMNRLTQLPTTIGALSRLKWLDLRFNKLEQLPDQMSRLVELESINLAENHLTAIPEWALALPRLRAFFVPGNPIPLTGLDAALRRRPDIEFDHGSRRRP